MFSPVQAGEDRPNIREQGENPVQEENPWFVDWAIGSHDDDAVEDHGQPGEVEQDGQGGSDQDGAEEIIHLLHLSIWGVAATYVALKLKCIQNIWEIIIPYKFYYQI